MTAKKRKWTQAEDIYLQSSVNKRSWRECADYLGIPASKVYTRCYLLGLKHSKDFIGSITAKNWEKGLMGGSRLSHFKKGHIPANKGKIQKEYMSEEAIARSAVGRFKKGQTPHNVKPVGSTRISKDGYIYIKTSEPNIFEPKHRVIWVSHYGPIPPVVNIQFKDKNKLNIRIDNLYAISRKNQIKQNTIQRYPKDIKDAIRIYNQLNKKNNAS